MVQSLSFVAVPLLMVVRQDPCMYKTQSDQFSHCFAADALCIYTTFSVHLHFSRLLDLLWTELQLHQQKRCIKANNIQSKCTARHQCFRAWHLFLLCLLFQLTWVMPLLQFSPPLFALVDLYVSLFFPLPSAMSLQFVLSCSVCYVHVFVQYHQHTQSSHLVAVTIDQEVLLM